LDLRTDDCLVQQSISITGGRHASPSVSSSNAPPDLFSAEAEAEAAPSSASDAARRAELSFNSIYRPSTAITHILNITPIFLTESLMTRILHSRAWSERNLRD
jgi:hypothetical protein